MLSYLTKGGVTYGDTERMSPYDRKIAIDYMKEVLDAQTQAREQAMSPTTVNDPKTGMTR